MNAELQTKEDTGAPVVLRKPVEVGKTLIDQFSIYERAGRELKDRLRRELLAIRADHERRWAETKQEFDRKISEAVARLERERADAEQALVAEFHLRKSELDNVLVRIDD